jgi:hypothetical protein
MHQKYDHVDLGLEEKLKKCVDDNKSLKMELAGMDRSFN